ncbi:aminoacyl-tRNA hydrolase [Candidatus Fermentibacteria bacterium]|nr:aminoacyl-tRNA hydrolase [Candidatus Fermentibacteria bacterium]
MPARSVVTCLGNPGLRYRLTWHNAGFWVTDILAREYSLELVNAGAFEISHLPRDRILARPTTYMNRSGKAVKALLEAVQAGPEHLLVVCDDVNLPLGRLRLRAEGSDGGHKGLRSLIGELDTEDFARLRMGIGPLPPGADLTEFVLQRIPEELEESASEMACRAADCVRCVLYEGFRRAQTEYNRWPLDESSTDPPS